MDTISQFDIFNLFAVAILGVGGIYLLLPHSHGRARPKLAHQVGYVLSTLAVLGLALFWKTTDVELVTKLFFYIFALGAVGCAILTIVSRDPVHSALWFAAVVLATSGLFLLSGAQFLAAGTVIVYAGAIIVTFLFVIMLAQKEGRAIYDRMARAPFTATIASFLLLFGLTYMLLGLRVRAETIPDDEPVAAKTDKADKAAKTAKAEIPKVRLVARNTPVVSAIERVENANKKLSPKQMMVFNRTLATAMPESRLPETTGRSAEDAHVASLGAVLYTQHLVTVELAGALLFAALIGALAIATPKAPVRPTAPAADSPTV